MVNKAYLHLLKSEPHHLVAPLDLGRFYATFFQTNTNYCRGGLTQCQIVIIILLP